MSYNLVTSGAIVRKAGSGVASALASSEAILSEIADFAEAELALLTNKDWVAASASIVANLLPAIKDTLSDIGGMSLIIKDMSGYTSRFEAQLMLDVLRDNLTRKLDALKEDNKRKLIGV